MDLTTDSPRAVPRRTLLVGCGKVGTRLGSGLVDAGGEVVALRRDVSALPGSFRALAVDLREPIRAPLPEVDAMVVTLTPGGASAGGRSDYAVALEHLADALPTPPERVVLVSSTRVFEGRADGIPITEDDAPAPASPRARALLEGERIAVERLGAHVVRPAGIYGPGRGMLVRKVLAGEPVQYARRTNRIHETDLVRVLEAMLAATAPLAPPAVLHAVDRSPASLGEVVAFIARRLGVAPPPRILPEEPSGTVLDGARLLAFLGELRHPTFESGYGELVAPTA